MIRFSPLPHPSLAQLPPPPPTSCKRGGAPLHPLTLVRLPQLTSTLQFGLARPALSATTVKYSQNLADDLRIPAWTTRGAGQQPVGWRTFPLPNGCDLRHALPAPEFHFVLLTVYNALDFVMKTEFRNGLNVVKAPFLHWGPTLPRE